MHFWGLFFETIVNRIKKGKVESSRGKAYIFYFYFLELDDSLDRFGACLFYSFLSSKVQQESTPNKERRNAQPNS
jgi:hypothetical protein